MTNLVLTAAQLQAKLKIQVLTRMMMMTTLILGARRYYMLHSELLGG